MMSLVPFNRRQPYCTRRSALLQKGEATRSNVVIPPTNQHSIFGLLAGSEPARADQDSLFDPRYGGAFGPLSGTIIGRHGRYSRNTSPAGTSINPNQGRGL